MVCEGVTSSSEHVASGVRKCAYLRIIHTVVYMAVSSPAGAALLQQDLNRLEEWEDKWQLTFKPEKCNVLRVT